MPYRDFGRALAMFARKEGAYSGVSEAAFIDPTAETGEGCTIYPTAYIGPRAVLGARCKIFPGVYIGEDCKIGAGTVIYPGAVLMSAVETGENCVIHAGVVLGAEGFGFARVEGGIQKIPQAGFTLLGDRVEIGPNSAVDRGALGPTSIGDDTKIDNLVQIGHNVSVGRRNLIVSQVGIAGSTKVGDDNTFAGQAGFSGHLKIGNNTVIGPRAGVAQDVPDGFAGGGHPLVSRQVYLRNQIILQRLPDLDKKVKQLEKELAGLKTALNKNPEQK
jgi:UDP-3-O-[3-hydroxymyristoyl] glucosamine N-acyltransferase